MAVAGGYDISIDGIGFNLARDENNRKLYTESFETLFANTSAIAGEVSGDQLRPNRIRWSITDWSGGEGAVVYYPQNSTQYDIGAMVNTTKRGQLTTRPKRRQDNVARAGSNADAAKRPVGGSAYTSAFIAWEDNIIESTDAGASDTWAAAQDTTPAGTTLDWIDAISDGTNIAFLHASGVNGVPVVSADASVTTWADTDTGANLGPMVGCVIDGLPYVLALSTTTLQVTKKASVMDTASDWEATMVFETNIVPAGTWGTNFWTSATAAETSGFFSYSTKTHAFVWEVRNDVGRPFYSASDGFAIKKLIYKSGFLFLIGNQAAAGSTFAEIRAIPLQTGQVIEGGAAFEPRRHQNTSLATFDVACAGNGPYIYAADSSSGKIFLYDIRNDAISLFDDLVNGGTGDGTDFVSGEDRIAFLAMHGARMFLATFNTADTGVTSLQVITYDDLEVQNRDAAQAISGTLETACWDGGLPMETKALMGFDVVYKVTDSGTTSGLVANSRITISYSLDDASYSTTVASGASATITSATTPSSGLKGRHYIQVSDGTTTQKFTRLKVKITLDNNSQAVAPPVVYAVVADMRPMAYERTWDLVIQLEDEDQNERGTSRQNSGEYLRTQLTSIMTTKDVVPFVDGTDSDEPNNTTTHTVVVESPVTELGEDVGQGRMALRLRSVT